MDISPLTRRIALFAAVALAVPLVSVPAGAEPEAETAHAAFTEVDLISDVAGKAPLTDPALVNPWGLALSATGPLWVANNGTNTATIYSGGVAGATPTKAGLTVTVPGGAPTGQIVNDTTDFVVTGPGGSGPAVFMFVSEGGDLTAWNPTANRTVAITEAHVDGSVYKGLALVHTQFGPFLSLANNLQYDSDSRVVGWQVRFRWIFTPGNDIYVVSLNNWLDEGDRYRVLDRNTATKIVFTRRF